MKHDFWTGKEPDVSDQIKDLVLDGGLDICKICGLYEGGLTTDCPGENVSYDRSMEIYHGEIDFRDGAWVPEKNPINQLWDKIAKERKEKEYQA